MMRLSPLINIHYMAKISGFQTKSMGRKNRGLKPIIYLVAHGEIMDFRLLF